jgi:hypothetical protein
MSLIDAMKSFFSFERQYDEEQNRAAGFGWFRGLNVRGEFMGWCFKCPGSIQKATVPAPANFRNAQGECVAEIPVERHVGCGFRSYPIPPGLDGLNGIEITCTQCRQRSSLMQWLKLNNIKKLEDVPSLSFAPASATQPRVIDVWGDGGGGSEEGYAYERSNPGGFL